MGVLILVAGFVVATSLITAPYNELVPGDALPVSNLITVPHDKRPPHPRPGAAHRRRGPDAAFPRVLLGEHLLDPANQIVPTGELTDNLPGSEFEAQGKVDMAESQLTAQVRGAAPTGVRRARCTTWA